MTYRLHDKLKQMQPYETVGNDLRIRLDANESFIDPGVILGEKVHDAVAKVALNRYPDNGYLELNETVGKRFEVDAKQVVPGNGSDELLALLIGSFMKNDETLLLVEPDFSMYRIFAETYERDVNYLELNGKRTFTAKMVLERLEETAARVFLFSNPASQTGIALHKEEVLAIVKGTDALVIVDEAYMDFADQSVLEWTEKLDNLVVLRTCSKAMGCAGIRLGFAIASQRVATVLNALRPPYNLNAITAAIGCTILSETTYLNNAIEEIVESRESLYQALSGFEQQGAVERVYPSQTNFIHLETKNAQAIYEELQKREILVRGWKGSLRITVGSKEENAALLDALNEIFTAFENTIEKEKENV